MSHLLLAKQLSRNHEILTDFTNFFHDNLFRGAQTSEKWYGKRGAPDAGTDIGGSNSRTFRPQRV